MTKQLIRLTSWYVHVPTPYKLLRVCDHIFKFHRPISPPHLVVVFPFTWTQYPEKGYCIERQDYKIYNTL